MKLAYTSSFLLYGSVQGLSGSMAWSSKFQPTHNIQPKNVFISASAVIYSVGVEFSCIFCHFYGLKVGRKVSFIIGYFGSIFVTIRAVI